MSTVGGRPGRTGACAMLIVTGKGIDTNNVSAATPTNWPLEGPALVTISSKSYVTETA
ncbi:hypothetical protein DPMN_033252 [Dreissena polymorpha]|uniref:Uncharacterized protein n=1 Tax=Dreissena polymorpha TaxID=45954 RepID=A0A9D4M6N4_DREPO|nr:hypothetical protein DPMN_033252 [Dreissena polymorpha]